MSRAANCHVADTSDAGAGIQLSDPPNSAADTPRTSFEVRLPAVGGVHLFSPLCKILDPCVANQLFHNLARLASQTKTGSLIGTPRRHLPFSNNHR
jgi:hypothetical protein